MKRPPAFSYPGSKAKMAKDICRFLPQTGNIYCEPFAGRGNVFWRAVGELHYTSWWLNDLRTIPWFKSLLTVPSQIVPAVQLTKEEDQTLREYSRILDEWATGLREPSIAIAPYLTFNGGGYGDAGRRGFGGGAGRKRYVECMAEAERILKNNNVKLTEVDYWEVCKELGPDDTCYLDPPYINCDVGAYKAGDLNHQLMIERLKTAPFRWILSEYHHPIYKQLGAPFYTKNVISHTTRAGKIECMWKNFPEISRPSIKPADSATLLTT